MTPCPGHVLSPRKLLFILHTSTKCSLPERSLLPRGLLSDLDLSSKALVTAPAFWGVDGVQRCVLEAEAAGCAGGGIWFGVGQDGAVLWKMELTVLATP